MRSKLACLLLFFLHFESQAQNPEWMAQFHRTILDTMKVTFKQPTNFRGTDSVECFKTYPKLQLIMTCAGNQLVSADGDVLIFLYIYKPFRRADSISMQKMFPNKNFDVIDKVHANTIRNNIMFSQGETAASDWKKFVTYYPEKEAKAKFNADTAIKFSINLKQEDFYKNKFQFLKALFIQKKDRGFLGIYVFHTAEGERKIEDYWRQIETIFKYED